MIGGPRIGRASALRRWFAGALARELDAFVVPGPEILDALGLDPIAAGLRLVANPRHATVLVQVGDIPPGLARAAAVAHAQQPRPRAILRVAAASQSALNEGVADLRRRLMLGAWDTDPPAFVIEEPHAHMPEMSGMDHMEHMEHMGHMGHGRGFMSMVMLTADLPRSADGLPMQWLEVPFGPLFPGLPGGLNLVLTLDGDSVAGAEIRGGTLRRDLPATWPGPTQTFADRLARIDPQSSSAYRILAWRALEQASGTEPDERETRRRIAALERERAASHLTWLARFGFLLGDAWLATTASKLARAVRSANDPPIAAFLQKVRNTPFLRWRLDGVGRIESTHALLGPVARACGRPDDTRQQDPAYRALGFAPTVEEGCDAHARLLVRLAEIRQSLDLIRAAESMRPAAPGHPTIETPRGPASVELTLVNNQVLDVALEVPSATNVHLVDSVAVGHELADALIGIASLDLSPWELDL